jgi:hypothetical protein
MLFPHAFYAMWRHAVRRGRDFPPVVVSVQAVAHAEGFKNTVSAGVGHTSEYTQFVNFVYTVYTQGQHHHSMHTSFLNTHHIYICIYIYRYTYILSMGIQYTHVTSDVHINTGFYLKNGVDPNNNKTDMYIISIRSSCCILAHHLASNWIFGRKTNKCQR